jgi:hypothetical protein
VNKGINTQGSTRVVGTVKGAALFSALVPVQFFRIKPLIIVDEGIAHEILFWWQGRETI